MGLILRGKKGLYFTIISVIIVSVLFFSLQPKNEFRLVDTILLTESRLGATNDFVKSLRTVYIPEAVKISSYKAAKAVFYEYKGHGGTFSSAESPQRHFYDIVTNGTTTKNGRLISTQDFTKAGTTNTKDQDNLIREYGSSNLNYLFRSLSEESLRQLNAELSFNYDDYDLKVGPGDPVSSNYFMVNATVNFSVVTNLANWTVNETYSIIVDKKSVDICFNDSDRSCFPLS